MITSSVNKLCFRDSNYLNDLLVEIDRTNIQGKCAKEFTKESFPHVIEILTYINGTSKDFTWYPDVHTPCKVWVTKRSNLLTCTEGVYGRWHEVLVILTRHLEGFTKVATNPITPVTKEDKPKGEHSGGSVSYYQCEIANPTTEGRPPYIAECNDIIEALDMTSAEANIFKEVWRTAAARTLGKVKAGHNAVYGAEKVQFFATRNLILKKRGLR